MSKEIELQIQEAEEIYHAIKLICEKSNTTHCQSWWLNSRNFDLKSKLPTPKINQRARLLVKAGYLTIDQSNTSTSRGTCYVLTIKPFDATELRTFLTGGRG